MRFRFLVALLLASATQATADGIVPGGQEPTRAVSLTTVRGAPVAIDSAYVDIVAGARNKLDGVTVSCVRYRNVASEPIVAVRFERTYYNGSRNRVGSDFVEDRTRREPNRDARPGTVPLAKAYWNCTHTPNRYGATYRSVNIRPISATFASGKTWALR
ncbi:MAG: hypothetical protein IAI50_06055 [Candidatus Eremiobacteraeota bacterium]|nr:hypothetical protein [Candidatus Eremiobacteraeota bacterium]